MKRLSWQWVNRFLVLIALILPIVYVVIWCFNLKGAGLVPSDLGYNYNDNTIWNYILKNNPMANITHGIIEEGDWYGFTPINNFVLWLSNFLGNSGYENMPIASLVNTFIGYLWWAFHVLLFDVLINGVTFFFRFIKKLMYMFEKED